MIRGVRVHRTAITITISVGTRKTGDQHAATALSLGRLSRSRCGRGNRCTPAATAAAAAVVVGREGADGRERQRRTSSVQGGRSSHLQRAVVRRGATLVSAAAAAARGRQASRLQVRRAPGCVDATPVGRVGDLPVRERVCVRVSEGKVGRAAGPVAVAVGGPDPVPVAGSCVAGAVAAAAAAATDGVVGSGCVRGVPVRMCMCVCMRRRDAGRGVGGRRG